MWKARECDAGWVDDHGEQPEQGIWERVQLWWDGIYECGAFERRCGQQRELNSAGAVATAGVGSPYAISASNAVGNGLGNYTISYLPGSMNVTPAPLTLRALNQSKIYGSTFSFNGTEFNATGLKNGETVGLVDLASAGAVATANVAGSPYAITIGNARNGTFAGTFSSSNYTISYADGTLSVTPAGLTITARNLSKEYGEALSFGGTQFTSVGLLNGDTIKSVNLSSAGALATAGVTGSPYAITAANAVGSGLNNYTISYRPGALSVTPAPLKSPGLERLEGLWQHPVL
jgi:hypothetical protein